MERLYHLDIVVFAVGFVLGCALGAASCAVLPAATGGVAALVHRLAFGRAPAVTAAAGFFAASLVCCVSADPLQSGFATHVGESRTDVLLRVEVLDGPRRADRGASYAVALRVADEQVADGEHLKLWVDRGEDVALAGDSIEVFARCARFAPREFPGQQSARERWSARGFAAGCTALERPAVTRGRSVRRYLAARRVSIEDRLHEILGPRAGVPIAMLTGTRGSISESEWLAHRRAGTAHLLAISGLHFGSLATLVWFALGFVLRRLPSVVGRFGLRRASAAGVLIVMAAYLIAVGAPVSATRAFVAVAAIVLAYVCFRRPSSLAAVATAAVAVLGTNPRLVYDLGFQLSFCATTAIVLFWHRLPMILDHDPYLLESSWYRRHAVAFGRFVLMSWLATAVTWPLLLGATGQLSVVALLTNLVAVPLVGLIVFPALLLGVLMLDVLPAAGEALVRLATEAMFQTTLFVEAAADLPHAVWTPGAPSAAIVFAAVLCVLTIAASRLELRVVLPPLAALAAIAVICGLPRDRSGTTVHYIPVGQGDSTLIEFRDGHRVLVDAGGSRWGRDPGRAVVVPYLWRLGITQLDAIVVTHPDTDHAAGVPAVLEHLDVDRVVTQPAHLGVDGLRLERWTDRGSKNDRSIVATIDAGPARIMLTGDVEEGAELNWLQTTPLPPQRRRVTVLKVPHHGSRTSSSEELLDTIRPSVAVVSAGRNNRFGHPHPWVVERYQERAIRLFSTAKHGLVRVTVQDGLLRVWTARP